MFVKVCLCATMCVSVFHREKDGMNDDNACLV